MNDELEDELVISPLGCKIAREGIEVEICIYRGASEEGWLLEIVDQKDGSTVWDDRYPTEQAALDEAMDTIANEGIGSFAEAQ